MDAGVTEAPDLARDVAAARERLLAFVDLCADDRWMSCPLADGDPRPVAVIVDHVADAYEYLGSFVTGILRGESVEVSPGVVDELNARHVAATSAPTKGAVVEHLRRSGDDFLALIEPLDAEQLAAGEGRITRFAQIAARHADAHRAELETALGLD
jgi:hypothetical protein